MYFDLSLALNALSPKDVFKGEGSKGLLESFKMDSESNEGLGKLRKMSFWVLGSSEMSLGVNARGDFFNVFGSLGEIELRPGKETLVPVRARNFNLKEVICQVSSFCPQHNYQEMYSEVSTLNLT